ncbi:hypothetical protein BKA70DRAFT_1302825 [Coprinopsis sp. MPI-PUGE-AT-0042]|nr:hypothetical protein BKA70DRAFT_1302825 [Coprinopsis sp. MPI-PUGE-AT-0042]
MNPRQHGSGCIHSPAYPLKATLRCVKCTDSFASKCTLIFTIAGLVVGHLLDLGYFRSIILSFSCVLVASTFLVPLYAKHRHSLFWQRFAVGVRYSVGASSGPRQPLLHTGLK